jgi:hypothetical protein
MRYEPKDDFDEFEDLGMSPLKLPWHTRLMLKFFPHWFLKNEFEKIGGESDALDHASELFSDKRIDIQPLSGDHRGFIITIDNQLSLFFYQDGDHFKFDGYEMGKYENGDVTVFDKLANK